MKVYDILTKLNNGVDATILTLFFAPGYPISYFRPNDIPFKVWMDISVGTKADARPFRGVRHHIDTKKVIDNTEKKEGKEEAVRTALMFYKLYRGTCDTYPPDRGARRAAEKYLAKNYLDGLKNEIKT